LSKYFDVANKTSANTELKTATSALFYEKNSYHFFSFGFLSNAFNSDADGSTRLGTGSKLAITRSKKTTRARDKIDILGVYIVVAVEFTRKLV
jgi:hypothetical protein